MANFVYSKGAEKIASKQINLLADNIQAVLVKNTYPPLEDTDEFYSTISAYAHGTPAALQNKTIAGGRFDADNTTISAPAEGVSIAGVAVFMDTGNPATSPLLFWFDTITGFPFVTDGGDVLLTWSNSALKIYSLK